MWQNNHTSAVQYPEDVLTYLEVVMAFGTILDPFNNNPISNCHCSPSMTHDKPNAKHRRLIVHLSWPKEASVNNGIDKDSYLGMDFNLLFPTIDHISWQHNELKAIGPGFHLYKMRSAGRLGISRSIWLTMTLLGLGMEIATSISLSRSGVATVAKCSRGPVTLWITHYDYIMIQSGLGHVKWLRNHM